MCFSRPGFRPLKSLYVPLELRAGRDDRAIRRFNVEAFPNFAVVNGKGDTLIPVGKTLGEVLFGKSPAEAVSVLFSFHFRTWQESGNTPPSGDVVLAQLSFLKSIGEAEKAEAWLAKALAAPNLKPDASGVLRVYQALSLRRAGRLQEGLQLLRQVAPELVFDEADGGSGGLAPIGVGRGATPLGTMSSDADARLAWDALCWLSGLRDGIPAPDGLELSQLVTGAVSLAAILNQPVQAQKWLEAYKTRAADQAFLNTPAAVYADALVMLASGKAADGARRLLDLVRYFPEVSYAQAAGHLARRTAEANGDRDLADRCVALLKDTYGPRESP